VREVVADVVEPAVEPRDLLAPSTARASAPSVESITMVSIIRYMARRNWPWKQGDHAPPEHGRRRRVEVHEPGCNEAHGHSIAERVY
jgi:hypothetical protein